MLNKKYLPSLGFMVLLVTVVSSGLFIRWALGPLSYEKAQIEETKGHQLTKDGKYEEASKFFLKAAKIEDNPISTSRRYRCAGTTAKVEEDKIKYYQLALKFNPNNQNAKRELAKYFQEIRYINRYADGWSKAKNASVKLNTSKDTQYKIIYFTSSPEKKEFEISLKLAGKTVSNKKIVPHKQNEYILNLKKGTHILDININETFNPKKLGMSEDYRDLGVHFKIIKQEAK